MPAQEFDVVIVGQGLAGSVLAWTARWRGLRVAIIDRGDPSTASRVAAGLVTPLTGKRWVKSWRYDDLWDVAHRFYRACEQETGVNCWYERSSLLLRAPEVDGSTWASEAARSSVLTRYPGDVGERDWCVWQLTPAARLDVTTFLEATRRRWTDDGHYFSTDLDLQSDVRCEPAGIRIDRLVCTAKRIVLCRGEVERHADWSAGLPWAVVKGELLRVAAPQWQETHTVHHQAWMTPLGDDTFLAGATFHRKDLTPGPTSAARQQLLRDLNAFVPGELDVREQRAALRPAVQDRLPVAGWIRPQVAVFNGLGSKGVLRAPWLAEQCVAHWLERRPLPPQVDLGRFDAKPRPSARRLTDVAHAQVAEVVRPGDRVIDATAGNGQDTAFLVETVGPGGVVYAFDIQREALARAAARVGTPAEVAVHWHQACHAELAAIIRAEDRQQIAAVMFNLGYLPRGDHDIVTQPETTVRAVEQALSVLKPQGVLTILAYTGHGGGLEETEAVVRLLKALPLQEFRVSALPEMLCPGPPHLFTVWKV